MNHVMADKSTPFAELMEQLLSGSEEAARVLLDEYGRHILRAVRQRLPKDLRPKFDSLDFTQDVWASFFADLPSGKTFNSPQALIAYLTRMAQNKVVDTVRQRFGKKFDVNREESLERKTEGVEDRIPLKSPDASASQIFIAKETWEGLLAGMNPVHRRIMVLLRGGKRPAEIAVELKVSEKTVRRVIEKALKNLPT